MKKILITGACGFIGSHLTEVMAEKGFKVVAFDRYNINNDYGNLEKSKFIDKIDFKLGDLRDFDSVLNAINGCDAVFHLGALIGIPYSYVSPLAYIKTNIEGTYNVLEASRIKKVKQVIITSTSETYGTAKYVPMNESHPKVGQSPYAASKIAADQLAISYYKSFNLPVKVVRPFNTYGPRQSARAVIPTIISQILNKNKILDLGNLSPTRDFTFVSDTCSGLIEIFNSKKLFGQEINIGSMNEISIHDVAQKIKQIMNSKIEIKINNLKKRPINSEVDRLLCDNSFLKNNSKWEIKVNLEKGLRETIKWIKKNKKFFKAYNYNI
jgi:NAD dependent epimerase/dehydratase